MKNRLDELVVSAQAYIYVIIQFVILGILVFYFPGSHTGNSATGGLLIIGRSLQALAIIGVLLSALTIRSSLSIMPIPKTNAVLGTGGLYKYVRHPMYSFVILFAIGSSLAGGLMFEYLLTIILIIDLYYKSVFEEKNLRQKFSAYAKYAAKTPRFIPFFRA